MPRKAATTTKKTTTKTTAKTAAKTTVKKEAKAYVFFNCDEEKSDKSMNIDYNNEVFKDTVASRKALWAKIASEVAVLKGNPCDATQQLHYGAVKELLLH